jgi:para-nitrobenzyl esterase
MLAKILVAFASIMIATYGALATRAVASPDIRPSERIVVNTTNGPVAGFASDGVISFLGMPYAKPPTGDLRFSFPQAPPKWSNLFPATSYGPVCPQMKDKMETSSSLYQNEDCLTLDVQTRSVDGAKRPVLVYIHGGAFIQGASADPVYEGTTFVKQGDIVFVSINYRLGVFGFLYLDDLPGGLAGGGNIGLLDQIAALQWVKANIEKFGGDPGNVTIMGESAGSISVTTLMSMPAAKGLFHKAIAQSGAPNLGRTVQMGRDVTKKIMQFAGVSDIAGLRSLSSEKLLDAQVKFIQEFGVGADKLFSPVVDGIVVPKDPFTAIAEGSAAGIALLQGTTKDEFRYWIHYDKTLASIAPHVLFEKHAPDLAAQLGTGLDTIVNQYKRSFPSAGSGDISLMLATDAAFWIPHVRLAEAQAGHANTWMYQFTWPSPEDNGLYGSPHAIEMPFVFHNLKAPNVVEEMGPEPPVMLADIMNAAWIAFVKTGSPQTSALPEWPTYSMDKRATMMFDKKSQVVNDPNSTFRLLYRGVIY